MYYAPGERWTSATMTDGTLSVQPLLEVQCIKRTVLRTGYGTHYSPSYPSIHLNLSAAPASYLHKTSVLGLLRASQHVCVVRCFLSPSDLDVYLWCACCNVM